MTNKINKKNITFIVISLLLLNTFGSLNSVEAVPDYLKFGSLISIFFHVIPIPDNILITFFYFILYFFYINQDEANFNKRVKFTNITLLLVSIVWIAAFFNSAMLVHGLSVYVYTILANIVYLAFMMYVARKKQKKRLLYIFVLSIYLCWMFLPFLGEL